MKSIDDCNGKFTSKSWEFDRKMCKYTKNEKLYESRLTFIFCEI